VLVEWTRTTTDAASEHGCNIGDRHYEGRAAAGYVRRVADDA
jgi:hypothetical protein